MSPDCPYCWLKDGANIDHICDVVNVKKNLENQWEITQETQRNVERLLTRFAKARKDEYEECSKIVEEIYKDLFAIK